MIMRNKILIAIVALIILGGALVSFLKKDVFYSNPIPEATTTYLDASSSTTVKAVDTTPTGGLNTISLLDTAWNTFENYLSRAHAHDIEGVKALSYKQSGACKNKDTEKQCFALMDNVYSIGKDFRKEDYVNIWSDEKQLIVFTSPRYDDTEKQYGLIQSYLYFTREKDGSTKLLAIDPARGWYVDKASSTKAQWMESLTKLATDSDKDGLTDNEENCLDAKGGAVLQCVKTNPQKRDSKGDGWWDGVRVYINRIY